MLLKNDDCTVPSRAAITTKKHGEYMAFPAQYSYDAQSMRRPYFPALRSLPELTMVKEFTGPVVFLCGLQIRRVEG